MGMKVSRKTMKKMDLSQTMGNETLSNCNENVFGSLDKTWIVMGTVSEGITETNELTTELEKGS